MADASLGLDNGRRGYRRCVLGLLRSGGGLRCTATADDLLRIAAVGGARSGAGARFPERATCVGGLCWGRSGRLACRITACDWWHRGDLRWRRVRQPPAREADAVGVLRTVAAYGSSAGAARVTEARRSDCSSTRAALPQRSSVRRADQSLRE